MPGACEVRIAVGLLCRRRVRAEGRPTVFDGEPHAWSVRHRSGLTSLRFQIQP